MAQSEFEFKPLRSMHFRCQPALVIAIGFASALMLGSLLWNLTSPSPVRVQPASPRTDALSTGAEAGTTGERAGALSPLFSAEVLHWEPQILSWATEFDLDPNLVAVVMQIESCGNPRAVSSAGARGLFQVMPFHFEYGEDMLDPDTNAARGLGYLLESLALTDGHWGMALAGYNGGHVAAQGSWESWPEETRRYYRWGSGIYYDVSSGLLDSPTLHDWLAAGGASLCQQAAGQLNLQ
ncbi:MAG: transglycosylase SLT domain-containing protein [Ardenticatenales bacterium]|nr:transglycosylase SLT domain-containing protein [Ardenticatenales bacterium]